MSWEAWTVFAAFLAYVVYDGVRRTRGAVTLDDYYAGGRKIPWWAAGLSIMATQASAITVIGTTGQGHESGMRFLQTYIGLPVAMVLLCIFIVPLLRERPILTAYEYLENRFGPATRGIASVVFLFSRCAALGVVLYGPAIVLAATTGLTEVQTILILGVVTTGYVFFGGVSAVVWTDVKQMLVIVAGLLITLCVLLYRVLDEFTFLEALRLIGGAGKLDAVRVVPEYTGLVPGTESQPSFWSDNYNLFSGLFGGVFLMLAYFGCDQSQAQRLLTSPSANDSRKALLLSGFAKLPMQVVVLFIGVLMWLFHSIYGAPLCYDAQALERIDPAERVVLEQRYDEASRARVESMRAFVAASESEASLADYQSAVRRVEAVRADALALASDSGQSYEDKNYVFPHFVLNELPGLLVGLIFAAIFAAAMSSADSVLNSLSAATIVDFYKRWIRPNANDRQSLFAARIATLLWGGFATFAAVGIAEGWFGGEKGASIIEQVNRIGSFFYGTLLGGFVLALVCRRAGELAATTGLVAGILVVVIVDQTLHVQFLWYNLVGVVAVVGVGSLVAWLAPQHESRS